ncbi:uncharacterized protein TNCV_846261 [Trichonephila clavipes]|nr:uncharacterized protein TNCV_846261 [Trichonephila clavipes]
MLQELWKSKASWDDPIPSSILENWNKFTKESKHLNSISIPRFMGIEQNSDIILHGFCDASTKAYTAVVYLKSKQEIHLMEKSFKATRTLLGSLAQRRSTSFPIQAQVENFPI